MNAIRPNRPELPPQVRSKSDQRRLPLDRQYLYQIAFFDDGESDYVFGIVRSPSAATSPRPATPAAIAKSGGAPSCA